VAAGFHTPSHGNQKRRGGFVFATGGVPYFAGDAQALMTGMEGVRIAELWDIGQEVPADSVNSNGMF
jgi:hypothetical protein